jgi:hypothetical protein
MRGVLLRYAYKEWPGLLRRRVIWDEGNLFKKSGRAVSAPASSWARSELGLWSTEDDGQDRRYQRDCCAGNDKDDFRTFHLAAEAAGGP